MKIKTLEVVRHRLETPLSLPPKPGYEVYIHPLVGRGEIDLEIGLRHEINGRKTIFAPPTDGWLLNNCGAVIQPHGALDLLVASVSAEDIHQRCARRVAPKAHEIGEGNHKRTVYEILGGDGPSLRLRCGETFNVKGGWSSWPPHSFDHDKTLAPDFEEIFVPFLRPKNGSALLRRRGIFQDGREVDDTLSLRSGEMVEVPLGFHPTVGGPDTDLMYVWFMVGPVAKEYGVWAEDAGNYK